MNSLKRFFAVIFLLNSLFLSAQTAVDIEQIMKAKPVTLSGDISTDMMYSGTDGALDNNNPAFQYFLKGNMAATFFGQLTIPLSFSYSNRKFDARYPKNQQNFNRFGISPKYKWVTVHAGWSNMSFSKYSLNGIPFVGGGVELVPGNYEIKLMHGRILKAVFPTNSISSSTNKPVFERWGSGFQVARKNKDNKYGLSVFRSADKYSSISGGLDSLGITPEENLVVTLDLSQKLNNYINYAVSYARSNITQDSRIGDEPRSFYNDRIYMYRNSSTKQYSAFKSDIGVKLRKMNIGVGYERIDPGYKSHGAYFYVNDIENLTISFASPFFKDKLNLNTSIGLEHDNLDKLKASTANRVVGNVNLSWTASDKLQFNSNYSNFKNITEFNPYSSVPTSNPYDNIDSLRFVQVSENTSLNMMYNTKTETLGHSLMVMLSMMQTDAQLGGLKQNSGAEFYNSNISYNINFIPKNIAATVSCNYNQMVGQGQQTKMLGPSLGVNTRLFKVVNSGIMYTWNTNIGKGSSVGDVQRIQYMASYVLKEKHNFNFSLAWMNVGVQKADQQIDRVNNVMARLGYSYSFSKK